MEARGMFRWSMGITATLRMRVRHSGRYSRLRERLGQRARRGLRARQDRRVRRVRRVRLARLGRAVPRGCRVRRW
jgi:hypothetical protein